MQLKNLFFSYSRADGAEFALRLAVDLQQQGFNVWIDQQDIRAGSEWDLEIEKALETCDCLLFIESQRSVTSTNVLDEVYYALEQNKRVIPLLLVDSKTPFRLKRLQHVDFTSNYDSGLAHLVQELNGAPVHPLVKPAPAFTQLPQERAPEANKRMPLLLGVLAAILVCAIAGYAYFSAKKSDPEIRKDVLVTSTDTLKTGIDTIAVPINNVAATKDTTAILPGTVLPSSARKTLPAKPVAQTVEKPRVVLPVPVAASPVVTNAVLLAEDFAGNWQLSGVVAPARGHRGYLKIEAVGENKIKVTSTFQFSFKRANDTAYFEVFNGFAGCASCTINKEITIVDNDAAFGAQIYKILRTDVAGEGKAGDTVMTVGPNKSINATMTLELINRKSAHIRVQRSTSVPMGYGMVIPPFDYTFRFTRDNF